MTGSTYSVRTACHFARFTPVSDFFRHTFCTVHTVHSVCSHLIISSLCVDASLFIYQLQSHITSSAQSLLSHSRTPATVGGLQGDRRKHGLVVRSKTLRRGAPVSRLGGPHGPPEACRWRWVGADASTVKAHRSSPGLEGVNDFDAVLSVGPLVALEESPAPST